MAKKRARERVHTGSRGVLREIDDRLDVLDRELKGYEKLLRERTRLLAARGSLTGEPRVNAPSGARRVSQDEVADYLREHPGSRAAEIARSFSVPLANISQHLYRGKQGRFESRGNGWHLKAEHG